MEWLQEALGTEFSQVVDDGDINDEGEQNVGIDEIDDDSKLFSDNEDTDGTDENVDDIEKVGYDEDETFIWKARVFATSFNFHFNKMFV